MLDEVDLVGHAAAGHVDVEGRAAQRAAGIGYVLGACDLHGAVGLAQHADAIVTRWDAAAHGEGYQPRNGQAGAAVLRVASVGGVIVGRGQVNVRVGHLNAFRLDDARFTAPVLGVLVIRHFRQGFEVLPKLNARNDHRVNLRHVNLVHALANPLQGVGQRVIDDLIGAGEGGFRLEDAPGAVVADERVDIRLALDSAKGFDLDVEAQGAGKGILERLRQPGDVSGKLVVAVGQIAVGILEQVAIQRQQRIDVGLERSALPE